MAPHPNPLPASLGEGAGCAISRCPSGQCLCPPLLPCPSESKELPLLEVLAERVSRSDRISLSALPPQSPVC